MSSTLIFFEAGEGKWDCARMESRKRARPIIWPPALRLHKASLFPETGLEDDMQAATRASLNDSALRLDTKYVEDVIDYAFPRNNIHIARLPTWSVASIASTSDIERYSRQVCSVLRAKSDSNCFVWMYDDVEDFYGLGMLMIHAATKSMQPIIWSPSGADAPVSCKRHITEVCMAYMHAHPSSKKSKISVKVFGWQQDDAPENTYAFGCIWYIHTVHNAMRLMAGRLEDVLYTLTSKAEQMHSYTEWRSVYFVGA